MKHLGTKYLETERLILRSFKLSDAEQMKENWAGDPEVVKYLTFQPHQSVQRSREIILHWLSNCRSNHYYQWGIFIKETKEQAGTIVVYNTNEKTKCYHMGYVIGKKFWNKGYMTEAVKEVIRYLFHEVGVNRIETGHSILNPASGRVMQKCGMKKEGVMRAFDKSNMGISDYVCYAILKDDLASK